MATERIRITYKHACDECLWGQLDENFAKWFAADHHLVYFKQGVFVIVATGITNLEVR